jgi:hypothetical protein
MVPYMAKDGVIEMGAEKESGAVRRKSMGRLFHYDVFTGSIWEHVEWMGEVCVRILFFDILFVRISCPIQKEKSEAFELLYASFP